MALKGGERHFKLPNIGKVVLKIVLWCVCVVFRTAIYFKMFLIFCPPCVFSNLRL